MHLHVRAKERRSWIPEEHAKSCKLLVSLATIVALGKAPPEMLKGHISARVQAVVLLLSTFHMLFLIRFHVFEV